MSQSRVVGAVEIGTSKVAVLLGEIFDDSGLNIIGHFVCPSKGIKKGVITDLNTASDCVHAAITAAERAANTRVDEVYLAQTGSHLQGNFNIGTTNVGASDRIVRAGDIEHAKQDAKRRKLPAGRTYIHHVQNPFSIDGQHVENPLSKEGERLQVGYWSVHGDSQIVSDSLRVISGIDLEVSDMIISSIASGAVLLEDAEKENGALIIDIGGGTTDYVLYRKGFIVRSGVIPVGGDHITNDLSIGLRVGRKSAEEFKIKHGRAYFHTDDTEKKVWLIGDLTIGDHEYPLAAITKIIEARISEIFEIIKDELAGAELFTPSEIASGVFLTGGGSRLAGVDESARRSLGISARVAEGPRDVARELRIPEYSTVLGLLHYALTGQEERSQSEKPPTFFRKIGRLLNFD